MNNPQAFPLAYTEFERGVIVDKNTEGMTLLDYFAAKALEGRRASESGEVVKLTCSAMATVCYDDAEAMLKEREKRMK